MSDFTHVLQEAFGAERVLCEAPLRDLTTFHVGGPASGCSRRAVPTRW